MLAAIADQPKHVTTVVRMAIGKPISIDRSTCCPKKSATPKVITSIIHRSSSPLSIGDKTKKNLGNEALLIIPAFDWMLLIVPKTTDVTKFQTAKPLMR